MKALLRARLLAGWRRWKSQAFELLVLGPIVGGGVALIADRFLMVLAPYLGALLAEAEPARRAGLLAALFFAVLAAAGVFRELYGERSGPGLYDLLPVSEKQRLALAACAAPAAALPGSLAFTLGGLGLAYWSRVPAQPLLPSLLAAWLALATLVALDYLLIQAALRLGLLRAPWMAAAGAGWLALLIFAPGSPLLLPFRLPGDVLAGLWRGNSGGAPELPLGPLAAEALAVAAGAAALFLAIRRRDAARAQVLFAGRGALRLLPAGKSAAAALLRRDLLLVLRRFSPLVPISFAASLTLLLLLPLLVARSGLSPAPLARSFAAGGVLAAAAWIALLPYLLAGQLRTFWLESSVGATAGQLGKGKVLTALILAAPPAVAAAALAWRLLPAEGGLTAIAILCGALTLALTMGLTIWETPLQPGIGLVYGLLIGGAFAGLFVLAPAYWPFWLTAYVYLASQLLGRVRQQVASLEQPR